MGEYGGQLNLRLTIMLVVSNRGNRIRAEMGLICDEQNISDVAKVKL